MYDPHKNAHARALLMKLQPILIAVLSTATLSVSQPAALARDSGLSKPAPLQALNIHSGGTLVSTNPTAARVRVMQDLTRKGYFCVKINEYSVNTCLVPSGVNANSYRAFNTDYSGSYLGRNRTWAWNCLNKRGQLWGTRSGQLWCQTGMR